MQTWGFTGMWLFYKLCWNFTIYALVYIRRETLAFRQPHTRYARSFKTHSSRVTHICVDKLTIIGLENGLSPGRRQAIIWTSAPILLIGPLWINFSEILIRMWIFSFKKMHLKMSSAKCRPFCLGLNVLSCDICIPPYGSLALFGSISPWVWDSQRRSPHAAFNARGITFSYII